METKEEFKKVSKLVMEYLKNDERCRNDDKWLTYRVMSNFTKIYIPFEDFKKIPAFETIKRCRAKIQNVDKLFLPTLEEVKKKRKQRQQDIPKALYSSPSCDTHTLLNEVTI